MQKYAFPFFFVLLQVKFVKKPSQVRFSNMGLNTTDMKIRMRLLAVLSIASLLVALNGRAVAQDAVPSSKSVPHFAPLDVSGFTVQGNTTVFKVFEPEKAQTFTFKIPTASLKRYLYKDSIHVDGHMETLFLERPKDFDYVAQLCLAGRHDARTHYKMYRASATGTLFLSILSPVFGLACALPASLTPPRIENLGLPDVDMLHEDIYFQAYKKEAWRKKNIHNWINFGIGFGIHAGILFSILSFVR